MSADLIAHMRYPEDLFNVQRTMMASYHVDDAAEFYSGGDFWKIPDDPTTPGQDQQAPYYLTLKMPGQEQASFSLSSAYIMVVTPTATFSPVSSRWTPRRPLVRGKRASAVRATAS